MAASADKVDDLIATLMRERNIPGLSLAVIHDGSSIKQQSYGFTDKNGETPVSPTTLFQAGSISKSPVALAALLLVEQGRLSLNEDINASLRTWKVPENEFTKIQKVTLAGILSHNAGLTIHGFPGYPADAPIPTLAQVLDGIPPANTAAIRVMTIPGSKPRYCGGGYAVLQRMMIDVTGKSFPELTREMVLEPLGMTHSTYEQPLPREVAPLTATGHTADGHAVPGRWHVYPEMAPAGLWTTAADLARFAIAIQQSFAGAHPLIPQSLTRLMLNRHAEDYGFGVSLLGGNDRLWFCHGGRNRGFDSMLMARAAVGQGVVILTNANGDPQTLKEIVKMIAREYRW